MFLGVFRVQVFHMHTKKLYWLASTGNTLNTVQSKKYGLWGRPLWVRQVVLPKEGMDETMKTLFELGVNQTFSLQKCSSEPAVYVSTMRQCIASEYFFERPPRSTRVVFVNTDKHHLRNVTISTFRCQVLRQKFTTICWKHFFARAHHYICKCKI